MNRTELLALHVSFATGNGALLALWCGVGAAVIPVVIAVVLFMLQCVNPTN